MVYETIETACRRHEETRDDPLSIMQGSIEINSLSTANT